MNIEQRMDRLLRKILVEVERSESALIDGFLKAKKDPKYRQRFLNCEVRVTSSSLGARLVGIICQEFGVSELSGDLSSKEFVDLMMADGRRWKYLEKLLREIRAKGTERQISLN